ncbi:TrbI/VirB10 family protein [Thioalkalivibrio sp. ALE16]|uniref:TrbI/VirB10 family protein n=1 Tax=Thioalkalivibrio sp. ALE16 TaxID=1158172 RepID=UPI000369FB96|nr:TrbI/VirB10 family protein [Thioalkalivibrio sp. ALE16]
MSKGSRNEGRNDELLEGSFDEEEFEERVDEAPKEQVKGKTPKNLAMLVILGIAGVMVVGMIFSEGGGGGGGQEAEQDALADRGIESQSFEEELERRQQEALERRRAREAEMQAQRTAQDSPEPERSDDRAPRIRVENGDPESNQSVQMSDRERALQERAAQSEILAITGSGSRARGGAEADRSSPPPGFQAMRDQNDRMLADLRSRADRGMEMMEQGLGRVDAPRAPGEDVAGGPTRNEQWLNRQRDRDPGDMRVVRDRPLDRPVVLEGSVIPVVLQTAVNSDLPGMITAISTRDTLDSVNGAEVVIPRGTRFVGEYNSDVIQGQNRLVFAFHRAMLPDGRDIDLGGMQGADAEGQSGMTGRVNTHFWSRLGRAGLIGAITYGIERQSEPAQVTQIGGGGGETTSSSQAAEIVGDVARDSLERNQQRPPTITIKAGETMNIMVNSDIVL